MEHPAGAEPCHRYRARLCLSRSLVCARFRESLAQLRPERGVIGRGGGPGLLGRACRGVPAGAPLHHLTFQEHATPGVDAKRHRQRQSLHRARLGLHHLGTFCPPHLGAARAILVEFQGEPVRLVNINSTDVRGTLVKIEGLSQDRVWSSLQRILEDTALCAFATVTTDNRAHVNTAYFAYSDELEVYFLSHPSSSHFRNVAGSASTSIAVL